MRTYEITIAEVENGWYARVNIYITSFGAPLNSEPIPEPCSPPPDPRSGVFTDRESALRWTEDVIKDTDE